MTMSFENIESMSHSFVIERVNRTVFAGEFLEEHEPMGSVKFSADQLDPTIDVIKGESARLRALGQGLTELNGDDPCGSAFGLETTMSHAESLGELLHDLAERLEEWSADRLNENPYSFRRYAPGEWPGVSVADIKRDADRLMQGIDSLVSQGDAFE